MTTAVFNLLMVLSMLAVVASAVKVPPCKVSCDNGSRTCVSNCLKCQTFQGDGFLSSSLNGPLPKCDDVCDDGIDTLPTCAIKCKYAQGWCCPPGKECCPIAGATCSKLRPSKPPSDDWV
ncbi:unnamed protein product [Tilletia controversa]|uniref:WAP domain-containing protein n=3 Tax=Tilletia TaxID=13289 RepID=A0A8X7MUV7_9BASI|nr:hypothetical protein CF336_g2072 [Tilletia laevis]KAE8198596.1 hypothetical protein CF328_g3506 [Tilletia controversa]KAE8263521.1 hypothetical protein A4X03_0g1617 [Tilletia caries]KAE8207091.1 hypothetical protein CF335_g1402 [Tilletia laevis]KAE8248233.1 hypothetical protein A4X06_0g3864 [Tilletia controversa]